MKAWGLKSPSMKAPVPTGFSMTSSAGSTSFQMCSGTMTWLRTSGPLTNAVAGKRNSTCVASVFTASPSKPMPLMEAFSLSMVKVKTTSSASNASPSVHFTPSRRVTASVVPSSFHEYSVPRSGTGSVTSALLRKKSGSKIVPPPPMLEGEKGLKLIW